MNNDDTFDPVQPEETPDEFNPHSPNFYQNVGGSSGGYVNDPFSTGYTGGQGPEEFSQSDGFQGFQGYYDNSGFENYEGYKGPNPYYRGYYGNSGFNPSQNNPAAYPGGIMPPSGGFTPDYDKLRENADSFYYKGYQSGSKQQNGGEIDREEYSMTYAHFSSISHLWSAISLVLLFCGAYLVSLFYRPYEQNTELQTTNNTIAIGCFIGFIICGVIAFKLAGKMSKTGTFFLLIIFSVLAGAALMPGIMILMGEVSRLAIFSFLASAVLIGILAVGGLITKQNLTRMTGMALITVTVGMIFYTMSLNFQVDQSKIMILIISTALLMAYAAVETYSVKRTYDEFICDDGSMYRNAAVAALGHYISLILFVVDMFTSSPDTNPYGRTSRYPYGSRSRAQADLRFANRVKINQSDIWK